VNVFELLSSGLSVEFEVIEVATFLLKCSGLSVEFEAIVVASVFEFKS
jgi:hypothetical protein